LLERIKARVPSVETIQRYQLSKYKLIFNKSSKDGSTKANIQKTDDPNDFVWGVIQRIDLSEKPTLDSAEGLGYGYTLNSFQLEIDNQVQEINFYIATDQNYLKEGNPYNWYLDYVIYGAIESDLPKAYFDELMRRPYTQDDAPTSRSGYDSAAEESIAAHKKQNSEVWP